MGLTALGVDRGYIAGLAGVGYRPNKLGDLMQFKALEHHVPVDRGLCAYRLCRPSRR